MQSKYYYKTKIYNCYTFNYKKANSFINNNNITDNELLLLLSTIV